MVLIVTSFHCKARTHIMIQYNFQKVRRDIVTVSVGLFRIMIPTLIAVKIAQELGFDDVLVLLFEPLMSAMSLPASMAVILVTTLLTNPYAGIIVATTIPEIADLSVGQMSILGLFMLFTHGLPLEAMVSRRVGVQLWVVLLLRILTAFLSAICLAELFALTGWYSAPASFDLLSIAALQTNDSLGAWLLSQIAAIAVIQFVIIVLVALLELLHLLGVERFMTWLLSPVLRMMGIGDRASTIAIVGVTLGLSFGSGLLMKDVGTGTIKKRDVFGVVCFVNLMHSVVEDTAVVMILGPSLFILLVVRLVISVIITMAIMALARRVPDALWRRYLTNDNIPASAG